MEQKGTGMQGGYGVVSPHPTDEHKVRKKYLCREPSIWASVLPSMQFELYFSCASFACQGELLPVEDIEEDPETNKIYTVYTRGDRDLFSFLEQKQVFTSKQAHIITHQITRALNLFWNYSVVHNDLTLENIMLDKYCRTSIIDLGAIFLPYRSRNGHPFLSKGSLRLDRTPKNYKEIQDVYERDWFGFLFSSVYILLPPNYRTETKYETQQRFIQHYHKKYGSTCNPLFLYVKHFLEELAASPKTSFHPSVGLEIWNEIAEKQNFKSTLDNYAKRQQEFFLPRLQAQLSGYKKIQEHAHSSVLQQIEILRSHTLLRMLERILLCAPKLHILFLYLTIHMWNRVTKMWVLDPNLNEMWENDPLFQEIVSSCASKPSSLIRPAYEWMIAILVMVYHITYFHKTHEDPSKLASFFGKIMYGSDVFHNIEPFSFFQRSSIVARKDSPDFQERIQYRVLQLYQCALRSGSWFYDRWIMTPWNKDWTIRWVCMQADPLPIVAKRWKKLEDPSMFFEPDKATYIRYVHRTVVDQGDEKEYEALAKFSVYEYRQPLFHEALTQTVSTYWYETYLELYLKEIESLCQSLRKRLVQLQTSSNPPVTPNSTFSTTMGDAMVDEYYA